MPLRLDGSETSFEETYPRAPFAPLIHLAVRAAEAVAKIWGQPGRAAQADPADITGPPSPLSPAE